MHLCLLAIITNPNTLFKCGFMLYANCVRKASEKNRVCGTLGYKDYITIQSYYHYFSEPCADNFAELGIRFVVQHGPAMPKAYTNTQHVMR